MVLKKNGNKPLNCLPMSCEGDGMFTPNGVERYSIKAIHHDVFACRHLFMSDLTVFDCPFSRIAGVVISRR